MISATRASCALLVGAMAIAGCGHGRSGVRQDSLGAQAPAAAVTDGDSTASYYASREAIATAFQTSGKDGRTLPQVERSISLAAPPSTLTELGAKVSTVLRGTVKSIQYGAGSSVITVSVSSASKGAVSGDVQFLQYGGPDQMRDGKFVLSLAPGELFAFPGDEVILVGNKSAGGQYQGIGPTVGLFAVVNGNVVGSKLLPYTGLGGLTPDAFMSALS
jgi:hypothetical protein